ncbi:MAG: DNA polymerase [Acidiferrobacteraceae bacterium]
MNSDFLTYNALDAACTLEAHDAFWKDLDQGFQPAYDLTLKLFPALIYMMSCGIKVDLNELETTKKQILQSAAEKQEELNKLCGRELNVNSSKDCQTYFYVELGISPYYNEGTVTVDDSALQRLSRGTARRPGLRQAKLVQEIRSLQKLHGTYLNIEFDSDGRMRCSYNPRGTKFGRLSSSKTIFGTGTNQQNLPQEFKRFLVADPGYVLWEIDKRQAEWVVVAYLTGDANMISVVEEGRDTHIHTASLMFGSPPEVIELENKLVGNLTDPDRIEAIRGADEFLRKFASNFPRTMSARQCGKKSNHGLNYDEGYKKFALINELDEAEARRIVGMYHDIYPGIKVWYESVKRQLQADRSLTNCFGRKVRFMDAWGPDLWKAAYSMLPQSSVVDSLNIGLAEIYADKWLCEELNLDVLAQVHDSILMQVPLEVVRQPELFAKVRNLCYNYVSPQLMYNGRTFKIATDSKMGLNWGAMYKDMNPLGMREVKTPDDIKSLLNTYNKE